MELVRYLCGGDSGDGTSARDDEQTKTHKCVNSIKEKVTLNPKDSSRIETWSWSDTYVGVILAMILLQGMMSKQRLTNV